MTTRAETPAERRVDALIHGLGLGFALAALLWLGAAAAGGDARRAIGLAAYGIGLAAMLTFSALYNLAREPRRRRRLRRYDHAAIFVMIAGSYTPFALLVVQGPWGTRLLVIVWLVALAGAAAKLAWTGRFDRLAVVLYLALGWIGLLALGPISESLSAAGLALLGIGGLFYSLGVAFHLWTRLPFQNAIWHALVLVAAACHFAAVLLETGVPRR